MTNQTTPKDANPEGAKNLEHQKLAHLLLAGVFLFEVLPVELARHGAPDLRALHVGQVARLHQVQPVGLVQLGADQKVEVADALVLAHQRGCKENAKSMVRKQRFKDRRFLLNAGSSEWL